MWKHGDKKRLIRAARKMGLVIAPQGLSNILCRRARAKPRQAIILEQAAMRLGYMIDREDWIYSFETTNKYFAPKDEGEEKCDICQSVQA